jgi:hypothetical protein
VLALFREEEDEDEGPENGHTSWRREGIIPSLYYGFFLKTCRPQRVRSEPFFGAACPSLECS